MKRLWTIICLAQLAAAGAAFAGGLAQAAADYEQRIGQVLPRGVEFVDQTGMPVMIGQYFDRKPVVLIFGYGRCPELCGVVADGAIEGLRRVNWTVGEQYEVVSVSIDPEETPQQAHERQQRAIRLYGRGRGDRGWNFLTGTEDNIRRLADAAGFHFTYDPVSRQYAHPSGLVVLTPQAVISSYLLGLDFPEKEMASALERAQAGRTGESVFELVIRCARGGGPEGKYGRLIWNTLGVSVSLTVLGLAGGVGWMLRQERRRRGVEDSR